MDVGVAVMNLRVLCKIIMCVSAFTEMAIIFFTDIVKAAEGLDILRICAAGARLLEGYHCGRLASH